MLYAITTIINKNDSSSVTIKKEQQQQENEKEKEKKSRYISEDFINLMLEEQTSIKDVNALKLIAESKARIVKSLKNYDTRQFRSFIESSDDFLRSHVGSRTHLVVLYVDLVGSTHMSTMLPLTDLTTVIQTFAQEMTIVVSNNYGYVLKYVGDALIAYFPVESYDNFHVAGRRALWCALNMLNTVTQAINPILEEFRLPKLHLKIGIDSGQNAIIEYASSGKKRHRDILGYPMNITAKITAMALPNQVLIGNMTYERIDPRLQDSLRKMGLKTFDYIDYKTGDAYIIHSFSFEI